MHIFKDKFCQFQKVIGLFILFSVNGSIAFTDDSDFEKLVSLSFEELLEVPVSLGTRYQVPEDEAPTITTVISASEITATGARSIVDVLRSAPGIDITHSVIVPDFQINSRGIYAFRQNIKHQFLINDHVVNAKGGNPYFLFNHLPIEGIDRIEILRGPGSALYGTDAYLGVIKLVTKQPEKNTFMTGLKTGSFNTVQPYFYLTRQKDSFHLLLCGDYFRTEGYNANIPVDAASNSPGLAPAASRHMTNDQESAKIMMESAYGEFYLLTYAHLFKGNNPVGGTRVLTDENDMEYFYYFAETGIRKEWSQNTAINTRLYYDFGHQRTVYELYPEETAALYPGFPAEEGLVGSPQQQQEVFGAEICIDYTATENTRLVTGLLFQKEREFDIRHYANFNSTDRTLDIDGINYPSGMENWRYLHTGLTDISSNGNWKTPADRTTLAAYLQVENNLRHFFNLEDNCEALTLTTGIRVDDYSDIGKYRIPRLGLVYLPNGKLFMKVLYGSSMRVPNFQELNIANNPVVIGNKNLSPEEADTVEIQIGGYPAENIKSSLTYFNITTRNLIDIEDGEWINSGKITADGFEGEIKVSFNQGDSVWANLTWQNVCDESQNLLIGQSGETYKQKSCFPGNVPEWMGNAGLRYSITKDIVATISMNYSAKRQRSEAMTWSEDGQLIPEDSRRPVPSRLLLNASILFARFGDHWEIQISGYNLLDEDHRDPDPSAKIINDIPQAGRSFLIRTSYSF